MSKINEAHSQVELKMHCTELKISDYLSRSNAQVFLLIKDQKTQNWTSSCSTEVIKGDSNPYFVKSMLVDYYFEELQEL
ncbi:10388_t:CDS:1, partial [Diversispora eburnea]